MTPRLIMWNLSRLEQHPIGVVPVVLGAGTPLFKASSERKRMKLRESRRLKTGGVIMYCEPERV